MIASLYSGGIYRYTAGSWEQIGIDHGLPDNRAFDDTFYLATRSAGASWHDTKNKLKNMESFFRS